MIDSTASAITARDAWVDEGLKRPLRAYREARRCVVVRQGGSMPQSHLLRERHPFLVWVDSMGSSGKSRAIYIGADSSFHSRDRSALCARQAGSTDRAAHTLIHTQFVSEIVRPPIVELLAHLDIELVGDTGRRDVRQRLGHRQCSTFRGRE